MSIDSCRKCKLVCSFWKVSHCGHDPESIAVMEWTCGAMWAAISPVPQPMSNQVVCFRGVEVKCLIVVSIAWAFRSRFFACQR